MLQRYKKNVSCGMKGFVFFANGVLFLEDRKQEKIEKKRFC